MKKIFALSIMLLFTMSAYSAGTTIDELKAFVNKAKEFADKNGKEKALAEFNKPKGDFVKGELYMFAIDNTGTVIAHGAKPVLIGKNLMGLKDVNGYEFMKAMVEKAKAGGNGCVKYMWEHSEKKGVNAPKMTYIVKMDDKWFIASGIYKDAANEKDWDKACN